MTAHADNPRLQAIGLRIREFRESLNIEQAQFARSLNISKNSQWSYEQGKTPFSVEYLFKLIDFGADVLFILTGRRDPGALGHEHLTLVNSYDKLSSRDRQAVIMLAQFLSGESFYLGTEQPRGKRGLTGIASLEPAR